MANNGLFDLNYKIFPFINPGRWRFLDGTINELDDGFIGVEATIGLQDLIYLVAHRRKS